MIHAGDRQHGDRLGRIRRPSWPREQEGNEGRRDPQQQGQATRQFSHQEVLPTRKKRVHVYRGDEEVPRLVGSGRACCGNAYHARWNRTAETAADRRRPSTRTYTQSGLSEF